MLYTPQQQAKIQRLSAQFEEETNGPETQKFMQRQKQQKPGEQYAYFLKHRGSLSSFISFVSPVVGK